MNQSKFYILGILFIAFSAGCSGTTIPNTTPQVNYVQGNAYIYFAQNLNASTGDTVAGSGDTITSVVLQTGISYRGMSNVTEIQNTHTNPVSVDTTYVSQSNGNYYHYNYGMETINSTPAALNQVNNGDQINVGWVLQAEFSAAAGGKWAALDTSITITAGALDLADTATESNDTTVTVGGAGIFAKHSVHSVNLSALGGLVKANLMADTYVSETDGTCD